MMKRLKNLFALLFVLCLYSCSHYFHQTYDEYRYICDNRKTQEGIRFVYLVDSIPFDTVNFQVIYKHTISYKLFYVSKDFVRKHHKKIKEKDVLKEKYPIFTPGFAKWVDNNTEFRRKEPYIKQAINKDYFEDEYFPDNFEESLTPINDEWVVRHFHQPPTFLKVYLIRGDVYDTLFGTAVIDASFPMYRFPDMNAFYKVVVPVWK